MSSHEEQRPALSVAFPAWNEEDNIATVLDDALAALPGMVDSFEILVVDDGSTDRTPEIVRSYAVDHPQVRLVSHPTNLGYGHALRTGLQQARGRHVATIDGDWQFRVADVKPLLDVIEDVTIGFRIKRMDPWHRLIVAAVYHRVLDAAFDVDLKDVDCGIKLFRREVVDRLLPALESRSAFISPELVIRARHAGYRVSEEGVTHYPRVAGRPKGATPKVIARTIGEIVRLRRSLGRAPSKRSQDG